MNIIKKSSIEHGLYYCVCIVLIRLHRAKKIGIYTYIGILEFFDNNNNITKDILYKNSIFKKKSDKKSK